MANHSVSLNEFKNLVIVVKSIVSILDPDLCGEGKKYKITKEISGFCKLTIDNCEPKDEATYACCLDKQPDKTETILSLSEYQYKFTKILKSARLIEKDTLTLACELNDARGLVKWFKNDVEIVADKRLEIISDGRKRKLVIRDAKVGDSGNFTCTSNSDKTTAEIIVNCEYRICTNLNLFGSKLMGKRPGEICLLRGLLSRLIRRRTRYFAGPHLV